MTHTNHTPAPWVLRQPSFYALGAYYSDDEYLIYNCDGALVCSVPLENNELIAEPEVLANAHLIASAPELLEALKAVLKEIQDAKASCEPDSAFGMALKMLSVYPIKNAEKAIAKAEGRA